MGNNCSNCTGLLGDAQELRHNGGESKITTNNLQDFSQHSKGQMQYRSNLASSRTALGYNSLAQQQPGQLNGSIIAHNQQFGYHSQQLPYNQQQATQQGNIESHQQLGSSLARNYFSQEETRETLNNAQNFGNTNRREKFPLFRFQSGAVYEGEWMQSMRDGYGIQVWPDGARYEGDWIHNKACGQGKFQHVDGDIYEGEWREDKANGYGTYIHVNGAKYEGSWKDDLQHGYGVETWADGSKYDGNYKDGKKEGNGAYLWPDGSQYQGYWEDNKISGNGTYTWLDGRKYEGGWLNNNMHGRGTYTWKDGRKYEGEYQLDKKHGFGTYRWSDGREYAGQWKHGKQHGRGRYVQQDGQIKIGDWQEGKRISWLDINDPEYANFLRTVVHQQNQPNKPIADSDTSLITPVQTNNGIMMQHQLYRDDIPSTQLSRYNNENDNLIIQTSGHFPLQGASSQVSPGRVKAAYMVDPYYDTQENRDVYGQPQQSRQLGYSNLQGNRIEGGAAAYGSSIYQPSQQQLLLQGSRVDVGYSRPPGVQTAGLSLQNRQLQINQSNGVQLHEGINHSSYHV